MDPSISTEDAPAPVDAGTRYPHRYPSDEWTTHGSRITDAESIEAVRQEIEEMGPVIVKHWYLRRGCGPSHHVFEQIEDYQAYLTNHVMPGDAIDVWSLQGLLGQSKVLTEGKMPDADGAVPLKGSY